MFFKKHELRIRVAKTDSPIEEGAEMKFPFEDPDVMKEITRDFLKWSAITIGGLLVLSTVLHTISEIVIKSSESNTEE